MNAIFNAGTPVPVNVGAIERELQALWKGAAREEGDAAVIRACSCNLLVLARDVAEAEHLAAVLARIAQHHPNRSLLIYAWPPEGPQAIRAWISAQCSLPAAGGSQVCSEVITLAFPPGEAEATANTILSLLVPDLPVYLYWPSGDHAHRDIVAHIAPWSNLLILDSGSPGDEVRPFERVLSLIGTAGGGMQVRDLEWARLTMWRDLAAQFFDAPGRESLPWRISEVRIVSAPPLCPGAFLLAGWLATSLDWKIVSADSGPAGLRVRFQGRAGDVDLRITEATEAGFAGISSVELLTQSGETFSVGRDPDSSHPAAACADPARPAIRHSVPCEQPDEADLIVGELSFAGADRVYEQALRQAQAVAERLPANNASAP